LEAISSRLEAGLNAGIAKHKVDACVQRVGSMLTLFFTKGPVKNWDDAKKSNTGRFGKWHASMLAQGHYWPPSQYEAAFVSGAHTNEDIDRTIAAADEALGSLS
jgi:glutamate-1-semialdehyde 2,1-aminomutase